MARLPVNTGFFSVDERTINRLRIQNLSDDDIKHLIQRAIDRTLESHLNEMVSTGLAAVTNSFGYALYTDNHDLWIMWTDLAQLVGITNPSQSRPLFCELRKVNHSKSGRKSVYVLPLADALHVAADRQPGLADSFRHVQAWWEAQKVMNG